MPLVLAYAATVAMWYLGWFPVLLSRFVAPGSRWDLSTFLMQLTIVLVVMPVGILLGALITQLRIIAPMDTVVWTMEGLTRKVSDEKNSGDVRGE